MFERIFVYGLEIDPRRMRECAGGWRSARIGRILDHAIVFDVPAASAGRLPNIRPNLGSAVYGIVYEVEERQLDALGPLYPGYRWRRVPVVTERATLDAWVLSHTGPPDDGPPSTMLLSSLMWAARQRGFPEDYLDRLRAWGTTGMGR